MNRTLFSIAAVSSLASAAAAQEIDPDRIRIETGLSTAGLTIAPSYQVTPDLHIRAPLYLGSLDDTFEEDGTTIDGSIDFQSFGVMADYYPFQNGFRVSAGIAVGGIEFSGSSNEITLNNETYTADFTATIAQEQDTAPVLSVGWVGSLTDRFGLYSELGARFTGLDLDVTGQDALDATTRAEFDADLAEANSELDEVTFIPYASVGVVFSF